MDKVITVLPNASSLIESMRSLGYSFETAISDVLDNSISANASKIGIYQRQNNNEEYIQIVDNGKGMDKFELIEAMRLGSKNPLDIREKNDLGRFGLGLKSASFSQCKKLTVISKKNKAINAYQWDLDLVRKTDTFSVKQLSENDILEVNNIDELISYSSGTIVQWENFDRIQESTADFSDELSTLMIRAIEHISLIFHRFLEEGLMLHVNCEPVIPKDPFLLSHPGTQQLINKQIKIDNETIYLYPCVIPHFTKLSASDKRKSGKVNEQFKAQGFYLYRNKRLIVWGDYLGLSKKTELSKNLRIKVDIPNNLDYLWEIDVKKSRASVPSKIKKNLLSAISDGESISKNVNTFRGTKELEAETPMWVLLTDRDDQFHFEINKENKMYANFLSSLDEEQQKTFFILTNTLEANIPFQAIYSQIGSGKKNTTDIYNNDTFINKLIETIVLLRNNEKFNLEQWLRTIISEEPYASNKQAIEVINEELAK